MIVPHFFAQNSAQHHFVHRPNFAQNLGVPIKPDLNCTANNLLQKQLVIIPATCPIYTSLNETLALSVQNRTILGSTRTAWVRHPAAIQDTYTYREVYLDRNRVDLKAKKELNEFLLQWLTNLIDQGHRLVTADIASATTDL